MGHAAEAECGNESLVIGRLKQEFIQDYIEYTRDKPNLKKQYDEAVAAYPQAGKAKGPEADKYKLSIPKLSPP